ncbi:MAG: SDR family NAD(P)-dependent oxidoreductase [Bryobacteraceae bacterium]
MNFENKVVVVTGGVSGIGAACSMELAARGGKVAMVDIDEAAAAGTLDRLQKSGGAAEFIRADVSKPQEAEAAIRKAVSRFGAIDALVNNAGIQRYGTVTSTPLDEWDQVLAVNLTSAFLMSRFAIPEMLKRGGGSIVMVGSVQSVAAVANSAAYVSSKHGMLGLTRSIALDYAKQGIRANCVCPGSIDTPMLRWSASRDANPQSILDACSSTHPLGRLGKPEEVAHVVCFLASELSSFVTGSAYMVDGGLLVPIGGMAFQESGTGKIR